MRQKVNDFTLFTDIDVKAEEYARKAFRARPQNLWVYLHGDRTAYEVDNISISGLCFKTNYSLQNRIFSGQQVRLVLASSKREFLTIVAQVVRAEADSVSCFFPNLSEDEEVFLDKLILEMQKFEIARRKLENNQKQQVGQAIVPHKTGSGSLSFSSTDKKGYKK